MNLLKKKITLTPFVFSKLRTPITRFDKCLKSLVPEEASTSNMVNGHKHCWNLDHSTFIIIIDHCQINWVGKRLSSWHAKILGLLFNTLTTNGKYPVLKRDNLTIPIQIQLSEKRNSCSQLLAEFLKSIWILEPFRKKDDPHSFCLSEITDSENMVR